MIKRNNITDKATEHGDYAYDYDDIYRLIDADNPTIDDEAFAYDPVGNRLTAQGVAGTWIYNDNNELTGYDDVSYVYDANGNMTQKTVGGVVTKFFYNTEDRLERVEEGDSTLIAAYYYDPFGRRLWKEAGGVKTYFLYVDEGLIGEYESTGGEIKTYGYTPGSTWTTDPLFMKEGSEYYFYHNDHLGTPQKLTSSNGAVVWAATYASFGQATVDASSNIGNNLRFPGQYEDEETRLHYNYFRYYDPETGRYFSQDPSRSLGNCVYFSASDFVRDPAEHHLYVYTKNSLIIRADKFGLFCSRDCPDCPEGKWKGSSFLGLNIFFGGGISVSRVFWYCTSSNVHCETSYFCFGGGAIAEASIDVVGTCNASGLYCKRDLRKMSSGLRMSGFGYSQTIGKIECTSGGVGLGGGVALMTCVAIASSCY